MPKIILLMKKEKGHLQVGGVVVSVLGNSTFRIKCENGEVIMANISAEFRNKRKRGVSSKILEGSRVKVRLSLNDLSLGSITSLA